MLCFRMFEPLHLATSDKIYPSKEGFYVVIISSIINELREFNLLIVSKLKIKNSSNQYSVGTFIFLICC